MKRIVGLVLALWVARWAALELASVLGRRRPQGPAPIDFAPPEDVL